MFESIRKAWLMTVFVDWTRFVLDNVSNQDAKIRCHVFSLAERVIWHHDGGICYWLINLRAWEAEMNASQSLRIAILDFSIMVYWA